MSSEGKICEKHRTAYVGTCPGCSSPEPGPRVVGMKFPAPTVGRVVHFHPWLGEPNTSNLNEYNLTGCKDPGPYAALVVAVGGEEGTVLTVFPPSGPMIEVRLRNVPFSEEPKGGHWTWPPRV